MAFSDFRNQNQVIERYGLGIRREDFIFPSEKPVLDEHFREQIKLVWYKFPFERSEGAASQALIFPILFEVWKSFRDHLLLLSQESLKGDDELCGVVDFLVCKKSLHGEIEPELPFLVIGEAKNDEFYRGWGQALSAMVAVQRQNGELSRTIFGIATNGRYWEFGKLEDNTFVLDMQPFSPSDLDSLMAALHFVFAACKQQLLNLPAPPAAA
jgi:hypothetical protein